jgi:dihydroflavonol-4-reductase
MVLITGGTGLVGSHLIPDLLIRGKKIRVLRRNGSDLNKIRRTLSWYSDKSDELFSSIEFREGDVTDYYSVEDALEGITQVYHCAARVSLENSSGDDIMRANIEGTANVVNACLVKNGIRLLHVSSVAAFGELPDGTEVTEDIYWKGADKENHYAISKYGAEREIWRGIEEGLQAVIVMPSVISAPGNWKDSSSAIFSKGHKGINIYTEGVTGFIDVRDLVKVMITLMESNISGERYIVSAENKSFREFATLLNSTFGHKAPSRKAGKFTLSFVSSVEAIISAISGKPRRLTPIIAKALLNRNFYNNAKVKKATGIEFMPIEQSIKDVALKYIADNNC